MECVALCNRTRGKAEALAAEFGVPAVYDDAAELLKHERLDFVDIITDPGTHRQFVELAAAHGVPVICQKPMAPTLADARAMAAACRRAAAHSRELALAVADARSENRAGERCDRHAIPRAH